MPIQDSTGTSYIPKIIYLDDQDNEVVDTVSWTHVREGATNTIYDAGGGGVLIEGYEQFPDYWDGRVDTIDGAFEKDDMAAVSATPIEGSFAARAPGGAFREAHSVPGDGLGTYVSAGSHHRVYHWTADWSQSDLNWGFLFKTRSNGNIDALRVRHWGQNNRLYLYEVLDGSLSIQDRQYDAGLPDATWIETDVYVDDSSGDVYGLGAYGVRVIVSSFDPSSGDKTQLATLDGDYDPAIADGSGYQMRTNGEADVWFDNLRQLD